MSENIEAAPYTDQYFMEMISKAMIVRRKAVPTTNAATW